MAGDRSDVELEEETGAAGRVPSASPQPNIGQLVLATWELFADRIVSGIRAYGFSDFWLADTQVMRNLDPPGTRITELARRAQMTKQAMSQLVRRLEERGYVTRRPDPADGRAKLVHLTDDGRTIIRTAQRVYQELVAEWEGALGAERFARLHELLTDLLEEHGALPRFHDPLDW